MGRLWLCFCYQRRPSLRWPRCCSHPPLGKRWFTFWMDPARLKQALKDPRKSWFGRGMYNDSQSLGSIYWCVQYEGGQIAWDDCILWSFGDVNKDAMVRALMQQDISYHVLFFWGLFKKGEYPKMTSSIRNMIALELEGEWEHRNSKYNNKLKITEPCSKSLLSRNSQSVTTSQRHPLFWSSD